ncbi:putative amino acid permease YhdG, partial [Smittium mucronatum]
MSNKVRSFFSSLIRKKDIEEIQAAARNSELKRTLSRFDLISLGVGCTIGTGIFVLTGFVAREYTGPSIAISFVIAGIASSLTAFSYAELSSIIPTSGSAYTFATASMGEFFGWIVGMNLVLEYLVGASTIAVGWSEYLSSLVKVVFKKDMGTKFTASPINYSAHTGFDAVASASQEAKNPQKDLPIGIIVSLLFCTTLYISVSIVMTGVSSYTKIMDGSIAQIFEKHPGAKWIEIVINIGAVAGLSSAILVSLMAQPRMFMVMSEDGLLPSIFSRLHPRFKTPYWSTIITGIICCTLSGFLP